MFGFLNFRPPARSPPARLEAVAHAVGHVRVASLCIRRRQLHARISSLSPRGSIEVPCLPEDVTEGIRSLALPVCA